MYNEKLTRSAPQARDRVQRIAGRLFSRFNKISVNEFVDNVSDKFESVKEEAEDFTEKSKAKFKEAKNA